LTQGLTDEKKGKAKTVARVGAERANQTWVVDARKIAQAIVPLGRY